jgi:5-carboxymethyl-2-hydroxymuconate isomerase
MPHLTIEYSDNLPQFDAQETLLALNTTLAASGQFEEVDIKSRAIRLDTFLVGTSPLDRAFVHAKLAILSGRSVETKQALSNRLLAALQAACAWPATLQVQLCVEVQEIERQSYAKASIG